MEEIFVTGPPKMEKSWQMSYHLTPMEGITATGPVSNDRTAVKGQP